MLFVLKPKKTRGTTSTWKSRKSQRKVSRQRNKKIHYYMWFAEMNNVNIYSGDWIIFQSHSVLKDTFRYWFFFFRTQPFSCQYLSIFSWISWNSLETLTNRQQDMYCIVRQAKITYVIFSQCKTDFLTVLYPS